MVGNLSDLKIRQARDLAKLVYLLQLLTLLFGITTVIGVLINHTRKNSVKGTLAFSHFRWQTMTFWITLAAVLGGFFIDGNSGQYLIISAVIWLYYRTVKGFLCLLNDQEAPRY